MACSRLEFAVRVEPQSAAAHRVGYRTPNAFVAAFRQVLGVLPGSYFAGGPGR